VLGIKQQDMNRKRIGQVILGKFKITTLVLLRMYRKRRAARTFGLESDQTAVKVRVKGGLLGCAEQELAICEKAKSPSLACSRRQQVPAFILEELRLEGFHQILEV
jgi:hypothetical protein